MTKNIININTVTCLYDSMQDRLRLTINYTDISMRKDFWITRGFILKLIPQIEQYVSKINIQPQKNTKNKQHTKPTSESTDIDMFQLTHTEAELLERVHIKTDQNSIVNLDFESCSTYARMTIPAENVMRIIRTIVDAIPVYGWGITPGFFGWE